MSPPTLEQFSWWNPSRWAEGEHARIRKPKEIACFSYDEYRNYHGDTSSLRYYYPSPIPETGLNLNKGYEKFRELDDTRDEHLDSLLKTILNLEKSTGRMCEANIVTWRGMLTKIVTTPYDYFSEFEMNITRFQGQLFIEEHRVRREEEKKDLRGNNHKNQAKFTQRQMQHWGYKFETLYVIPDIWDAVSRDTIERRDEEIVSNYAQYCSVVRSAIGNTSIVIGGEVDAIWDEKPEKADQAINWVELKTTKVVDPGIYQQVVTFERKLLRMWAQSFLLNVPKIVIGFRDENGILLSSKEFETQRIPAMVKKKETWEVLFGDELRELQRSGQYQRSWRLERLQDAHKLYKEQKPTWDGFACLRFADDILNWTRQNVEEGIWRMRKRRNENCVEVVQLKREGHGLILSDEFVEWRQSEEFTKIMQETMMQELPE